MVAWNDRLVEARFAKSTLRSPLSRAGADCTDQHRDIFVAAAAFRENRLFVTAVTSRSPRSSYLANTSFVSGKTKIASFGSV
jgi:hypothetical protein